jgi:hypothetical protein
MVRHACAGSGVHRDVRVAIGLPAGWRLAVEDSAGLVLTAGDGAASVRVTARDVYPEPFTAADTLRLRERAVISLSRAEFTLGSIEDMRLAREEPIHSVRARVTRRQMSDSALVALVRGVSVRAAAGQEVTAFPEVHGLAGQPAGYLSETDPADGARVDTYVTFRDGALFVLTLRAPAAEFATRLPLLGRIVSSFHPGTERGNARDLPE